MFSIYSSYTRLLEKRREGKFMIVVEIKFSLNVSLNMADHLYFFLF